MTTPKTDNTQHPESAVLDNERLKPVGHWLDKQVTSNRIAGGSVLIVEGGRHQYFHTSGIAGVESVALADHERASAVVENEARIFNRETVVRLYSMTKPVTTVAAMMLYEQGKFQLDDPIANYLPAFKDMRVWTGEGELNTDQEIDKHSTCADSQITVRQLMNHTSGLTYGFMNATPVDQLYRDQQLAFPGSPETLASLVDRLAQVPLLCQPGTQWNYSVATDVLGRLVEVWSGMSLSDYFRTAIFDPLGMHTTGFHVRPEHVSRFADLYGPAAGGELGVMSDSAREALLATSSASLQPPVALDVVATTGFVNDPSLYSGGGGLVGSIDDYSRFCQCLLDGGSYGDIRLLKSKTVDMMRANQLPDNRDMAEMGDAAWSETSFEGIGFGLGFATVLDPAKTDMPCSKGDYHWGGAASTCFWIDPVKNLFVVFLTQLFPSSSYPLRSELRAAVYQALD